MGEEITFRRLGPPDANVLEAVAEGTFDGPVRADSTAAFLASPDHEMVVALDGVLVVGMISGVVYWHPDKLPELWVAELGVAGPWHRRGIGAELVAAMVGIGRLRGCRGVWVLTDDDNAPALATYRKAGGRVSSGHVMFDWDGE
ncbi:GNAT family N-acetyltransferase [Pseudoruegeria sp. HB172150]|uniref:GNAT family N-acetyltransferase n=1 Tax=Pseudoruegeria sp. HB172150 TaxID=2721164 RepID=UPI001556AC6F|nr:GNAT family N-acetyltransferase [Pseudoruegeria sp. HB172150]